MRVRILQLKEEAGKKLFLDYETAKKTGFSFGNYKEVYKCDRPTGYTLENAYEEFNIHRPNDFTGHSISVSDIVEIDSRFYYCDSIGWKEIEVIDTTTVPMDALKKYSPVGKYEKAEAIAEEFLGKECEDLDSVGETFWEILRSETDTDEEEQNKKIGSLLTRYLRASDSSKAVIEATFTDLCGYGFASLIEFTANKLKGKEDYKDEGNY